MSSNCCSIDSHECQNKRWSLKVKNIKNVKVETLMNTHKMQLWSIWCEWREWRFHKVLRCLNVWRTRLTAMMLLAWCQRTFFRHFDLFPAVSPGFPSSFLQLFTSFKFQSQKMFKTFYDPVKDKKNYHLCLTSQLQLIFQQNWPKLN